MTPGFLQLRKLERELLATQKDLTKKDKELQANAKRAERIETLEKEMDDLTSKHKTTEGELRAASKR